MTLQEASNKVGSKVLFYYRHTPRSQSPDDVGVITSVNDLYVFVRFGDGVGSQACVADDLVLEYR